MKALQAISFPMKLLFSLLLLVIVMLIAVGFGAANTSLQDVVHAITGKSGGDYYSVLREIRFPRVIAAFFVGSALSVAGAIMQGVTRNSLADPGLLGLTAGANVALSVTLAFIPSANYLYIIVSCFIGAAIGMLIVFGIDASTQNGLSPLKLILAGSAVSLFLQAVANGIGILFSISKDISMWTAGGLIGTTWQALMIVPVIVFGIILSMMFSRPLTILSLNEEVAVGLGQNTKQIRTILLIIVVILTGSAVALVGNIAFVGLIIPHIVRMIVGSDYRMILPMSISIGGTFMVFADFISRSINAPFETPVVAIISIVALPFFLFIIRKGGRNFV